MTGTATPENASEYEDEDFDVVNAERIEGVDDDEDTAEEHDPEDAPYEEDEDVRPVPALGLACVAASETMAAHTPLQVANVQLNGACLQDAAEASKKEMAKAERERLKMQDQMKRQRLDELRQQQNSAAETSEVRIRWSGWPGEGPAACLRTGCTAPTACCCSSGPRAQRSLWLAPVHEADAR